MDIYYIIVYILSYVLLFQFFTTLKIKVRIGYVSGKIMCYSKAMSHTRGSNGTLPTREYLVVQLVVFSRVLHGAHCPPPWPHLSHPPFISESRPGKCHKKLLCIKSTKNRPGNTYIEPKKYIGID